MEAKCAQSWRSRWCCNKYWADASNLNFHPLDGMMQDFPYHFEEGVEHHNIWCTVPLSEPEVLKVAPVTLHVLVLCTQVPASEILTACVCLQVVEENRQGYEYVWFTNPGPLQSIPTVSTLFFPVAVRCCHVVALGTDTRLGAVQVWHAHVISKPLGNGLRSHPAVHAAAW